MELRFVHLLILSRDMLFAHACTDFFVGMPELVLQAGRNVFSCL
jgi:hypothetical protein